MQNKSFGLHAMVGAALVIAGIVVGLWLRDSLPQPKVDPVDIPAVVPTLTPVEQHVTSVLASAQYNQKYLSDLLPWTKKIVDGESVMLIPVIGATGIQMFVICPASTIVFAAQCSSSYVVNERTQMGHLLRAGTVLTLTLNLETDELYVNDRVGYSVLPGE